MAVLRACFTCGRPTAASYCEEHTPKPWQSSERRDRLTVTSGWAEQRRAKRILERYLGCCHVCGNPGADQVDHGISGGAGGADEEWNLAPIHTEPCHREKTAAEARRART